MKEACDEAGVIFTIWMTRNFTAAQARQAVVETGAQGFIAEGEIPAESPDGTPNPQAQNWVELVHELADLEIGKAVATNWSPFTHGDGTPAPEKAKALIEDGWHCMPYVYPSEHTGITIERQAFYARHFTHEQAPTVLEPNEGWYAIEPVLGCYGGFDLDDFPTRANYLGWSVWSAGSV